MNAEAPAHSPPSPSQPRASRPLGGVEVFRRLAQAAHVEGRLYRCHRRIKSCATHGEIEARQQEMRAGQVARTLESALKQLVEESETPSANSDGHMWFLKARAANVGRAHP